MSANPDRPAARLWHPRHWLVWAGVGLLWCVAQLPYAVQYRLGCGLGALAFRLSRRQRAIARVNLDLCFPERDDAARARLLREHFRAIGVGLLELGMSWWGRAGMIRRIARITGMEHLEAAAAAGRGVILLGAHFITLEISGRILSQVHRFDVTYRPDRNPVIDHVVRRARARRYGMLQSDDVRGMLRALGAGHSVWYAPDENFARRKHLFAPFFGIAAATNPNTARFAELSGAPVVPFFARRLPGTAGYEVVLLPALEGFPSADPEADAARVNRQIEDMIRMAPDQYLWIQKRFLQRPAGEADLYGRIPG